MEAMAILFGLMASGALGVLLTVAALQALLKFMPRRAAVRIKAT